MIVPQLDLGAQYQQLRSEIDAAVQRVLASGIFVDGAENEALEHELADYIGVAEVICVNSGTDALLLSLKALGIGAGDEVIVPSFTFFATAEAVALAGAQPRFADCSSRHYNVDTDSVRRALTRQTKAIIAVHLFGQPVDMAPLQEFCESHGLWLIEDAAQAIGARYRDRGIGSFGTTGAFSFYPTKNLGACGDGGAISCNDRHWPHDCAAFVIMAGKAAINTVKSVTTAGSTRSRQPSCASSFLTWTPGMRSGGSSPHTTRRH
jgi:dTDP-4-amino-4,6-dideoxygalactose transaminase